VGRFATLPNCMILGGVDVGRFATLPNTAGFWGVLMWAALPPFPAA